MLTVSLLYFAMSSTLSLPLNPPLNRIGSLILLYTGVVSLSCFYAHRIGSGIVCYLGFVQVSNMTQSFEIFLLMVGSFILVARPVLNLNISLEKKFNLQEQLKNKDYSLIVLFSSLGSLFLMSSFDLLAMFIGLELQSFALYILTSLNKDSYLSTGAGLKYFLLGGLSSCLILLGISILYTYTGVSFIDDFQLLLSKHSMGLSGINEAISLALVFVLIGLLFKVSAAPLHNWAPDVYDDSNTIVTIWISIIPKISIFIFLFTLVFMKKLISISYLLLISSLLSLIIGSLLGLTQIKIKRLLAYSTINHVGFMLLALSMNSVSSLDSYLFYILSYSMTNLNIFLIILAIGYLYKTSLKKKSLILPSYKMAIIGITFNLLNYFKKRISRASETIYTKDISHLTDVSGLFKLNPILSISLAVTLFSMAGMPPLIGFFGKAKVLYSAISNDMFFMAILAILVSVISASYYLDFIKNIFILGKPNFSLSPVTSVVDMLVNLPKNARGVTPEYVKLVTNNLESTLLCNKVLTLGNVHAFILSMLTLFIFSFMVNPSILSNNSFYTAVITYTFKQTETYEY